MSLASRIFHSWLRSALTVSLILFCTINSIGFLIEYGYDSPPWWRA